MPSLRRLRPLFRLLPSRTYELTRRATDSAPTLHPVIILMLLIFTVILSRSSLSPLSLFHSGW